MAFDLIPKNKQLDDFQIGSFSWPIYLQDTGMGYVLGYGAGFAYGTYVYQTGQNGSPSSNDGYVVTSAQAKAMAMVARGFVSVQRFVNKEWDALPEEERKTREPMRVGSGRAFYREYMHEDHLKKLEAFADFADKSKGFTIN